MGGLPALAVQGKGGQAAHGTRALATQTSIEDTEYAKETVKRGAG
jgi:hypothetical protein